MLAPQDFADRLSVNTNRFLRTFIPDVRRLVRPRPARRSWSLTPLRVCWQAIDKILDEMRPSAEPDPADRGARLVCGTHRTGVARPTLRLRVCADVVDVLMEQREAYQDRDSAADRAGDNRNDIPPELTRR